jgi:hypothetical protein
MALMMLQRRARRAYERGRLLMAFRIGAIVVPLAAIAARATGAWARCAAVGGVLFMGAVFARWRRWRGVRSVDAGLLTGVIPLAAALMLCRFASAWEPRAALSLCTTAGFVAGALAARSMMTSADGECCELATASVIAGLTAALGCIGIGFGTAAGAALGVTLGAIVAARLPRHV